MITNTELQIKCSDTLTELFKKYENSEYMLQRLNNHIINYLPNTLDNEFKNYENLDSLENYTFGS